MDYEQFYHYVVQESEVLKGDDIAGDYRRCKALAACYELMDYLANRIAASEEGDPLPSEK